MSEKLDLGHKTPDQIKAEYYELMSRILDLWLKIPLDNWITQQQEMELRILEDVAMSYIDEMKSRNIYLPEWLGHNG